MAKLIKNLYEILEVSPRARSEIIEAAYKTLIRQYHPDRYKGGDQIAKQLNEAKDILLDQKKRLEYDMAQGYHSGDLEGKIIGNYKVMELIAEGGFGKTYKGEQIIVNEPVCIKHSTFVSPQDEEILLSEAKSIWNLRHYSIPVMRDMFKLKDNSLALVMSYIPGPTLEQILAKVKKLDPEHVAWIAERSLNALKYLHYNGIIHGDVKPQNIIVQPESHMVVLVDYGLSLIRPSAGTSAKGYTPYFAPPEQVNGGTLVPESDFYGLGMTMIYALGGDIAKRSVPSNTPDSLCALIKRMIKHDVMSRPSWDKEDLCDTIQDIRFKEFKRKSSNMKPIVGV